MSFTNQMLGALGTATGALAAAEHIADQKQQKAFGALGQLETATSQSNLKEAQQDELEQILADAEKKEPEIDIIAKSIESAGKVDRLNALDKKYSEQMDKGQSRDDKTGKFISEDQANERYDDLMDELRGAKKAHESLQNKLIARDNMRKNIDNKKEEVRLAKQVKDQAKLIYEKNKKYLPKGPKGGNE